MIESVRAQMRSLEKSTKKMILKGTMYMMLILAVLFIFLSTQAYESPNLPPNDYQDYLNTYSKQYSE